MLTFRWALATEDEVHESEVSVRADNASERGVPLPAAWQNAMRCRDLSSRAEAAGNTPEAVDGVSELWFASLEDFRDRYWSGPGVAERESKETGRFLDFSRTWSMIVRERVPLD